MVRRACSTWGSFSGAAADWCARLSGQPTGTVTLVFTDIEGSTRLLEQLGPDRYRDVLSEHRRVLRAAFERYGGYEVDYEGDAFFVAFPDAAAGLAAASEAQAGLAGGSVLVRMGLHTGEPLLDPPKYVGRDVHLAARVMSAGHGGQVLLTHATAGLVDASILDLGEHRFKDFDEPVRVYQLGDERFPPLKTISNTNLPQPASSFVGRDGDVAEIVSLIRGKARLLTLTGPGGSGKTRLAIEAAAELVPEFKAAVLWVGLAALRDPALVVEAIAQTLGAKGEAAVHIGERKLLLLLDNFEQVVDGAPELAALVEACPNLVVLVTSRELLRVRGEVEYQVLPLAEPDAVELFCARARVERSAAVEELCRRLDNMPLALELAAARAALLTVEQILGRLSQRLDLFKGGRDADPRQQTLRATIEWSYELLSVAEQGLFARLAVFVGGCRLEAAEKIAGADLDTLQSLVEKSLLRRTDGRLWMLETIRHYAAQQLEVLGEVSALRLRHAEYYLGLASRIDEELRGPAQDAWMERVGQQHANFAAAMSFYVDQGAAESALRMGAGLARYWARRGAVGEGRTLIEQALRHGAAAPPHVRANALWGAAHLAYMQDDFEHERTLHEEALDLFTEVGDARGKLLSEMELGWIELALGRSADLSPKADEYVSAAQALSDDWLLAFGLQLRGGALAENGEFERARRDYSECVTIFESVGDARSAVAAGASLGWFALLAEEYVQAASLFEETAARAGGDSELLAINGSNLGLAKLFLGNDDQAVDDFAASLIQSAQIGSRRLAAESLLGLAAVAARASLVEAATRLKSISLALHEECHAPLNAVERRLDERFLIPITDRGAADAESAPRPRGLDEVVAHALSVAATIKAER